jgi:hypothetical protein
MLLATPVSACSALAALGLSFVRKVDDIAFLEHGRDLLGLDGGDTMLPRIGTNSSLSSI